MEITTQFIAIVSLLVTGAGTSIGIYIKFNNDLALATFRIGTLEKKVEHLENKVEEQGKEVTKLLGELKEDIHGLRLLIEQNK